MHVFRWQHKDCENGPLCGQTDFPWNRYFKEHNFPCDDEAYSRYREQNQDFDLDGHYFAWISLDKLMGNLEEGAASALEKYGFELTEWEVRDKFVVLGDGQVFFHRASALRVS